jgi:hypothetical protein
VVIFRKKQNYLISKEEVENIIEYVWDKELHNMKVKQLLERLYVIGTHPESSIGRPEILVVSVPTFMD